MKRNFLTALSVLFLALPLAAQQPKDTLANALLWEISGPGITQSSWLFGTIHLIAVDSFDLPDRLLARLSKADRLVLELNMDEATNPMTQLSLLPKMMMPDGIKLRDLLEDADYKLVMERLDAMGLPGFLMESIKPLFLSALIDPSMAPGGGGVESYDMTLYELAKKNDMQHSGLESIEEQLAAFDAVSLNDQAKMLVEQLRATSDSTMQMDDLVRFYKQENLTALQAMMDEQQDMDPGMMESLLYGRNRRWIPIMQTMMATERVFFAVGAGHLAGEEGVIRLLQKQGFILTPIPVFH